MTKEALTEWFCYVKNVMTIFSVTVNVFHNAHQERCYNFFIVEIVVERANLTQMSK